MREVRSPDISTLAASSRCRDLLPGGEKKYVALAHLRSNVVGYTA
ncbi:hypothetical protein QOV31_001692 [Agrobacterium fabrum]|jgi:hypothetical protein|nr:hypothetical protein QOV31_001692 [Agrobacterium fabrum]CAD0207696.1 hypothetical protein AGTUEHA105_LOCUS454 [Agrobacterium tumefaciens]